MSKVGVKFDYNHIGMSPDLTLVQPKVEKYRSTWFDLVQCKCGNQFKALHQNLVKQNTTSCGCQRYKITALKATTHGLINSKVYRAWCSIKRRCYYQKDIQFADYGGRGIKVSDEWLNSFETFFLNMGHPPTNKHTIDRVNVNGNYCKENCKWSTYIEQGKNRRNNKLFTLNGITKIDTDWSLLLGFKRPNIQKRITRGWSKEDALTVKNGEKRVAR